MTDWKQKIEAQIAALADYATGMSAAQADYYRKSMQALLDVAVAVEAVLEDDSVFEGGTTYTLENLKDGLDALREVGDE